MCIDIYDRYLDCEKDHKVETYHRCLKAYEYVLDINNDGCRKSRVIYCLISGPCPKCELGSDCFDSDIDDPMDVDISDDEKASVGSSGRRSDKDSDVECWGTGSVTEAETSEPEI